jgi:hypothetical protein
VLDLFGRVPRPGERKETDEVAFSVEKVARTRVLEILLKLPGAVPAAPAGGSAGA